MLGKSCLERGGPSVGWAEGSARRQAAGRASPRHPHPHAIISPCSSRAKWMSNASKARIVALYIHFARV